MKEADASTSELGRELRELRGRVAQLERVETVLAQVQAELRQSKRTFDALLNATTEMAMLIGADGTILAINDGFAKRLCQPVSGLVGKRVIDFLEPDFAIKRQEQISKVLSTGEPLRFEDERAERIIDHHLYPVFSGDRQVEGVAIFARDVTENKLKARALHYSQEMLSNILSASPIAISYVEHGKLKWTNPAMVEMFGYGDAEEYLGKDARDFYSSSEEYQRIREAFLRGLQERLMVDTEAQFKRKDGSIFHGQLKIRALDASDFRGGSISTIADITARKEAEAALRDSEERYRALFEHSRDAIAITHRDGRFVDVNQSFLDLLDYRLERIMEMNAGDLWADSADRIGWEERIDSEGYARDFEAKLLRRDGSVRYCMLTSTARTMLDGSVQFQTICRDFTDRKQAEEILRQSEETFRMLTESAPFGLSVMAADTKFEYFNRKFTEIFGYTIEDLPDKRTWFVKAYPDEDYRANISTAWRKDTIDQVTPGEVKPRVFRVRCKDGEDKVISFRAVVISEGRQILTYQDVTAEVRAQESILQAKNEWERTFDAVPDLIMILDNDYRVQRTNKTLLDGLNITAGEIIDAKCYEVLHCPTGQVQLTCPHAMLLDDGNEHSAEIAFERPAGVFDVTVSPLRDEQGRLIGAVHIARDITERKKLEDQLRHAQKMEAIGRLAGGVAHDFNNLLTAIIGYSNLLMEHLPENGPDRERLVQIDRAAERAAALTQQLLAFSRKQVLDLKVMNLNEVISDLEKMLRRLIGEDVELRAALDNSIGSVKVDPNRVEQILINLAINARDAMPHGGKLTIETTDVTLDEDYARSHQEVRPGPYVMCAVSDNGVGMDPETLSRVFEPFFTTKEKGVGTGLGLSTVYGIVKQHEGHISAYSEPGLGTTFKVYFPRVEAAVEEISKTIERRTLPGGTETILVVEDEEIVLDLSGEILQMLGYTALKASSPRQALAICEEYGKPIHLLLTDVVLPQMDGRSLFDRLAIERPDMQVLYVSGYADNAIVHQGVLDPGVHFLQKPFSAHTLACKVRQVLD
ncbi:MAG: PAS domain S-box protein [Desulfomonile tiedjei]|nr:PAS domain S-box protein [Desulfomonile tiedjei]